MTSETKTKKTKEAATSPAPQSGKAKAAAVEAPGAGAHKDTRFKFKRGITVNDNDGRGVTLAFTCKGGPTALIQVGVFDANDKLMSSVGFAGDAAPLSTAEKSGPVDWGVNVSGCKGGYVKIIYVVLRGAANLPVYHVRTQVWQDGHMTIEADVVDTIPANASVAPAFADGFNID